MKLKLFTLVTIVSMLVVAFGVSASPVQASAYTETFTTSITYQNVSTAPATVNITFYAAESSTPIPISRPNLPGLAGTSLFVGSLSELGTGGFRGSAVLYSNQPVVATLVQLAPAGSTVKNRPLSNGFESGSPSVMIPSVLKNQFNYTSQFSVQNVDSVAADLTINFFAVGSTSPISVPVSNLPAGAAKYIDMGTIANITAAQFNGSATITAVQHGTSTPGAIVASAMELSTNSTGASAFEATAAGGTKVYMPSAFCNFGAGRDITSAYAVQNVHASQTANVTVTYSNGKSEGPIAVTPGSKKSFNGCGAGNTANFIGSAVISTSGGSIVALGKIGGSGLSTAFLGATSGADTVAAPYVRWTTAHWADGTRQQVNIAIQNVGGTTLAAGSVTVNYYDLNGVKVGSLSNTTELVDGAKFSSNAGALPGGAGAEFGYFGTAFGGSAIVQGPAGSQLVVVVRVASKTSTATVGEDYNGIPISRITLP